MKKQDIMQMTEIREHTKRCLFDDFNAEYDTIINYLEKSENLEEFANLVERCTIFGGLFNLHTVMSVINIFIISFVLDGYILPYFVNEVYLEHMLITYEFQKSIGILEKFSHIQNCLHMIKCK